MSVPQTAMMAAAVSSLLLLLLLAGSAVSYNDSDSDSLMQEKQWGSARATWYGQPNGAGPYDNGMYAWSTIHSFAPFIHLAVAGANFIMKKKYCWLIDGWWLVLICYMRNALLAS